MNTPTPHPGRQDTPSRSRAHAREGTLDVDARAVARLLRAQARAAAQRPRTPDEAPLRTPRVEAAVEALLVAAHAGAHVAEKTTDDGARRLAAEVARVTRAALARLVERDDGTIAPEVEAGIRATEERLDRIIGRVYAGSAL